MVRLFSDDDQDHFHAKRKKATMELLKGKELATRLQAQLLREEPSQESDGGLRLARQLAHQILRSFTVTLATLSPCAESSSQIANAEGLRKKPSPGVKDRRGCYKRRRTLDSWVTMSSTKDDGLAWRKYGQKVIMSSKHPRCYFRCTHKPDGCKATKQVQRIEGDSVMYQTTYFNHHTCTETLRPLSHDLIADSDTADPSLISFRSNNNTLNQDQYSPNPISTISSQLVIQEEFKEDNGGSEQDVNSHEPKSTMQDQWGVLDNDTELESLGYKPDWEPIVSSYDQEKVASGFDRSCECTSLHGLDMEVNQLGDIDYSLYFD